MDDIMLILFDLLKILIVVTLVVVILTYGFSLIMGKRKVTKEEKALADRKEVVKQKELEARNKTKTESDGKRNTLSNTSPTLSEENRTSKFTRPETGDFATRITSTEKERSKKRPVITLGKQEGALYSKNDSKRIRSKKKKVSPRMEVVYIKMNYYNQQTPIKVFK